MRPDIWGPPGWFFLHSITLNYPENPTFQDKNNIRNFFNNLSNVLPCDKCKYNYTIHLRERPLTDFDVSSRNNLIKWLIDIHNLVNISNGKKKYTYDESIKKIMEPFNESEKSENNYFLLITIFLILFIIIVVVILFMLIKK